MRSPLHIVGRVSGRAEQAEQVEAPKLPKPADLPEPAEPDEPPDPPAPETRLFRRLQRVIDALSADRPPTYRERSELRAVGREAVDAYVTDKLAERAPVRPPPRRK